MSNADRSKEKQRVLANMEEVLKLVNTYMENRCFVKNERIWACRKRLNVSEHIAKNLIMKKRLKFSSIFKVLKGANALDNLFFTFVLNEVKNVFAPLYPCDFMIMECKEEDLPELRHSCAGEVLKDILEKNKIQQVDIEVSSGFGRTTLQDCIGNRGKNNFLTNLVIFWECYKIIPGISKEEVLEFMYLSCSEIIGKGIRVDVRNKIFTTDYTNY